MPAQKQEGRGSMNKVLVIDDDKELCALMKKCVEQESLVAVVANGGIEGLRILEENQNKRMNGIKEHILHLFYQFVNCIQHIVIV